MRPIGSPTAACPCPCALCSMTSQICRSPDRQRALDYPKPQHLGNAAAAVDQPARCALWRGTRTLHHGQLRHASGAGVPGSRAVPRVIFPTAPTRCPARSWRRRSIARGSLYAVALPNRSSALGSKTIRSTGSCPRRSEAMRRPRSRRRVLAARGAPTMFHKGRAPRDHGKAKGPASDRIRAPDYKARCVNSSDYLRCAR